MDVVVAGSVAGTIRDDDTVAFEVRPGQHAVRLKLLWISSPTLLVDVEPGGETWIRCGPNGGILQAWRLFVAVSTAIFIEPIDVPGPDVD